MSSGSGGSKISLWCAHKIVEPLSLEQTSAGNWREIILFLGVVT